MPGPLTAAIADFLLNSEHCRTWDLNLRPTFETLSVHRCSVMRICTISLPIYSKITFFDLSFDLTKRVVLYGVAVDCN
jgi:hypothetical protein